MKRLAPFALVVGLLLTACTTTSTRVADAEAPVFMAFNRRFDPSHRAVYDAIRQGEVGEVEIVSIVSRDPYPPPVEYLERSPKALFRETTVHDFDLARWLLGEERFGEGRRGRELLPQQVGERPRRQAPRGSGPGTRAARIRCQAVDCQIQKTRHHRSQQKTAQEAKFQW